MTPTVVLWDADGVLQRLPGAAEESMRAALEGRVADVEGALAQAISRERPALAGHVRWLDVLSDLLEQWGCPESFEDMVAVWLSIEPVEGSRALVQGLRAAGVPCHLASNQDERRARHMREHLGYPDLLDGEFYSCDLGVAKPDPGFFTAILERLGLPAHEALFVDDRADNVATARSVGMVAEVWSYHEPVTALEDHLVRHGLPLRPS